MFTRLFAATLAACLAPAAARAADEENPYKTAKVGDYTDYKLDVKVAGIAIGGKLTQSVTAKDDKEATVKVTGSMEFNGQKMDIPPQEQKIDLTMPFDPTKLGGQLPGGGDVKLEKLKDGKEKIKVGGKEYEATWTTYKMKMNIMDQKIEGDMKVWMAKNVPTGLVKMEMTAPIGGQKMEMTMEMSETGNKKKED